MDEYAGTWKSPADRAYESDTHWYPSHVVFEGEGRRGAPDVRVRCEMRDGIPEVVDFRLTSKPNGRAVRSADLNRWQPLEGLAINGFREHAIPKDSDGTMVLGPRSEREHWLIGGQLEQARASRNGPTQAELEEVARVYLASTAGTPTAAVRDHFGYSTRTASRRVKQAEEAGLLPPQSAPGKKRG